MPVSEKFDLAIIGGTVWTPGGPVETDVGVRNGRFAGFGHLRGVSAATLDAKGLTVLPGVIDSQVHFREPGLDHKEDLESGTRGAALGGVVGVFEMPNTDPPTTTADAINDKISRALGRAWVDFAFFVGASPDNVEHLGDLECLPGVSGVKMFMGSSTGSLLVPDDENVRRVLKSGRRRVAVHCEDQERLEERAGLVKGGAPVAMHAEWRDVETALRATTRLVRHARDAGRRVHTLHITTAEEMVFLQDNRDVATVEVLPQHLTLSAPEAYERLGSLAQMNPPIRDSRHREALWRAVRDGVVDCIGSDHAPHTLEEKQKPYPQSPSGLTGVQTLVPIMLDHVNAGRLTLQRFIDLTSAGPARIFGIAGKGRVALGYDADLTIVDLKAKRTISNSWIASKSGWTAYDGMSVTGWPIATVVRGQAVMRDDQVIPGQIGAPVLFTECL